MKFWNNKSVWITGASAGIGEALAREFCKRGAAVALSARRVERLEALRDELRAGGSQVEAIPCDVTDEQAVAHAAAEVVGRFGRMDAAVANAGVGVSGPIEALGLEDWRRQFDVNVFGAVMTAKYALPALRDSRGHLALVSSVAAMICTPGTGAYSASKYALRAIGQTLAMECERDGVSCTTLYPGFVESEIARVDNQGQFHAERPDPRPKFLMWKATDAARVMVDAIEDRKRDFVFTRHGKLGAFLGQHMPGLVHMLMKKSKLRAPKT